MLQVLLGSSKVSPVYLFQHAHAHPRPTQMRATEDEIPNKLHEPPNEFRH